MRAPDRAQRPGPDGSALDGYIAVDGEPVAAGLADLDGVGGVSSEGHIAIDRQSPDRSALPGAILP